MKLIIPGDEGYEQEIESLVNRCEVDFQTQDDTVRTILEAVKQERDAALLKFTNHFDRTDYRLSDLEVTPDEIQEAYNRVELDELDALKKAAENITRFHERQVQESWEYKEGEVHLGQMVRPLATAGLYVPGGKASYPSSVLMNALPARVAGVEQVIMCSPTPDGEISPHTLVAADIAGVDRIFKVGGAQAVAAMALGTEMIPKVDKIVGPGNIYVALAKRMVFGLVDIDMIAGPSEILVVADESARPDFVAADLLSQAEHDEEAVPLLVTPSESLARETQAELEKQKKELKRSSIIDASLNSKCRLIVTPTLEDALDLANRIAPEHLELAVENPRECAKKIKNAGAIFLGHYTPEAMGDYLAGPNHVLPTSGTARFSSPLGVYDFVKRTSLISYNREELIKSGKTCRVLAEMENLDGHAHAVHLRML
ncbi:MAG: histidinol dehydrogenase [Nitrospinaceae bacterium]|nr:histidinol dehydrogenase [Nitrospinaceae bacterium]NIR56970.1 histidinol dehydrogenase [Nitrospinaceae bacterium]NIS87427.1 histidinol dehydrogenase [Nitrospinaceae bacterium]NIT83869.1 histidinol dehydrogenase [Nitrospinaceae bacterium]NIU46466.1 histidinol dehydrogenase [Nitrospinaceae bacterium]